MTKVRTLELVLTPAIRCMLRAQPHVNGDGVIVEIPPSEVDFPGTDVLMRVQTQELLAKRVQALQPLLRRKGASGCFYSRRALSQICRVPYHLLKPHDEHKPVSQSRMLSKKTSSSAVQRGHLPDVPPDAGAPEPCTTRSAHEQGDS